MVTAFVERQGVDEVRRKPAPVTAGESCGSRRSTVCRANRLRSLRAAFPLLVLALLSGGCSSDPSDETARLRGDRAFARGDFAEALAEYRLSLQQEDPGTEGLVRAAHAYVTLGRIDEARALYDQAAREDSIHADQAVSDFAARARQALADGDSYGAASAMEAAAHFRPGVVVEGISLLLARHYSNTGEYLRAQPFFLRAREEHPGDPDVVFETASAHLEIGDCERALGFFEEFRELAPRRGQEASWPIGTCSFRLAEEIGRSLTDEEAVEEALEHLNVVIDLGEPRTLLSQAWFHKAEILAGIGECAAAIEAYRMVPASDPAGSGPQARTAKDPVDEIRFGEGEGPC